MRVLVTGNMGYVGPAVVRHLRQRFPDAWIAGFDSGFFATCLPGVRLPETALDVQYFGDVRDFPYRILDGIDVVVHLAAISNDPMGHRFERVTSAINHDASDRLATAAASIGVRQFVFASSCSIYGAAADDARTEDAPLNPLTAYARSKIAVEQDLARAAGGGMTVTSLRFATACGMSDRVRLDLVLNDFVASALATGHISVLSDGTPWRPLIDVADMARAIEWAATREPGSPPYLVVNVGRDEANYQVRDLADAVAKEIHGTQVTINAHAPADNRSYRVSFARFRQLAPDHQPLVSLLESIRGLRSGLETAGFRDPDFRSSRFVRLHVLERHITDGRLDESLRWR